MQDPNNWTISVKDKSMDAILSVAGSLSSYHNAKFDLILQMIVYRYKYNDAICGFILTIWTVKTGKVPGTI